MPPVHHRSRRVRRRDEDGFTLVELMVAMTIFTVMLVGFGMLLSASLKSYRFSRARTVAETVGSGEVDEVRQLAWSNLGVVSGNPPGTLLADEDVTVGKIAFHIKRAVELVDDNVPTYGYNTGANYKHVTITVSSNAMTTPLVYETLIAPPTQPSLYSAAIRAHVSETCSKTTFAPGWNVTVEHGPSPTRVGVTDALNNVQFSALIPTNTSAPGNYYDVSASLAGWLQMPAAPVDSHFTLDPGQTPTPSLLMYKPATVTLHLKDALGQPVTSPYSLDIKDWTGASAPTLSGQSPDGTVVLSTFGSGSFVSCKQYTFVGTSLGYTTSNPQSPALTDPNYPATSNADIDVTIPIPPRTKTTFHLVDTDTGAPLAGAAGIIDDTTNPLEPDRAFTTDASGAVTFDLLPDSFAITATKSSGYFPGNFTYTVPQPPANTQPTPLDVTLTMNPWRYTTVVYSVLDSLTNQPVGGVTVLATGGPGGNVTFTTDTVTGTANVTMVQATYSLSMSNLSAAYQPFTPATFTVSATTTANSLAVAPMGAVTFTVNNGSVTPTTPLAAVGIKVSTLLGTTVTTLTSGTDGTVATYLTPGSYKVDVTPTPSGFGAFSTATITVPQGPYSYPINLLQFGTTNFVVRNANGLATVVTNVALSYAGGPSGSGSISISNGTGSKQLLAGTYTITRPVDSTYQAYTGTLTVGPGGTATFNVDLYSTTTVNAKFKGTNQSAGNVGAATLKISGPGGTYTLNLPSGGSSVTVSGMKPGIYTVTQVTTWPSGYTTLQTQQVQVINTTAVPIVFLP